MPVPFYYREVFGYSEKLSEKMVAGIFIASVFIAKGVEP